MSDTRDKPYDGLNGTVVLKRTDMPIGYTGGSSYYAASFRGNCLVTAGVRVERLQHHATYSTTRHQEASEPLSLSISFCVWNRPRTNILKAGQCDDALRHLVRYADGWNRDSVRELRLIAQRWHANDTHAACIHQAGPDSSPCAFTGYSYGHDWLVDPLPEYVLDKLRSILPTA